MMSRRLRNALLALVFWNAFLGVVLLVRSKVLAALFGICFGVAAVIGKIAAAMRKP